MLIYPTKQAPFSGLAGMGGGTSSLVVSSIEKPGPPGCDYYWDFGSSENASFNEQHGSGVDFTTNQVRMALQNTEVGGPPGFTAAGKTSGTYAGDDLLQTSNNSIPDMTGDFTLDFAIYNPHGVAPNQNIPWCIAATDDGSYQTYIYNYYGSARFDMANQTFQDRIGEAAMSSNYVEDVWCVSRLRRSGNTMYAVWYYLDSGSWTMQGSEVSSSVSGYGPSISGSNTGGGSKGHFMIGGWNGNSSFSISSSWFAWAAFWKSSHTDTPWMGPT